VSRRRPARPGGIAGAQLVVVTGKGGVGKSTVSAALARYLARDGRRIVLLELDPREPLHHLLDVAPSAGEPVAAGESLQLLNLRPRAVLELLVRDRLKIAALARTVIASPIFGHFVDGAPGLKELAALGHALRMIRGEVSPRADVVVLDAPATGHGVQLLAAPGLVTEAIGGGPVGRLAGEVAELVTDRRRTAVVVTTLAEEMPVDEALELIATLRARVERVPDLVVVNGLYPPVPAPPPGAGSREPETADALGLWRARREMNERELARLVAGWSGPRTEIPLLPIAAGPALVARIAELLGPALSSEVTR